MFFYKSVDFFLQIDYNINVPSEWAFSSVGQSTRLITGWSGVRISEGPPFFYTCLKQNNLGKVSEWLKEADCKSVSLCLRWFESIPFHQKVEILTNFSFFYFYLKLFVSIDITVLHLFSLFKPLSKLFAIFYRFFVFAQKLHGRIARKNSFYNSTVAVNTRIYLVRFLHGKDRTVKTVLSFFKVILIYK